MAAGDIVNVAATADEDTVTLTLTAARPVTATTVAGADPGTVVLSILDDLLDFDGLAVTITGEE